MALVIDRDVDAYCRDCAAFSIARKKAGGERGTAGLKVCNRRNTVSCVKGLALYTQNSRGGQLTESLSHIDIYRPSRFSHLGLSF
jgi:hypothetical protein